MERLLPAIFSENEAGASRRLTLVRRSCGDHASILRCFLLVIVTLVWTLGHPVSGFVVPWTRPPQISSASTTPSTRTSSHTRQPSKSVTAFWKLYATETEPATHVRRKTTSYQDLSTTFRHSDRNNYIHASTMEDSSSSDANNTSYEKEDSEETEETDMDDQEVVDEDQRLIERQKILARTALLGGKKSGSAKRSSRTPRSTSVGARRIGSTTQARQGVRKKSQILDALRKTARVSMSKGNKEPSTDGSSSADTSSSAKAAAKLSTSVIHSTIEGILRKWEPVKTYPEDTDAFMNFGKSFGILGEPTCIPSSSNDEGTILTQSLDDNITVRVATPDDDVDVANLRLSVFSDFSPEVQSQFCVRSCQAIGARRRRGATCVVATEPSDGYHRLLGSAECSSHEFLDTRLGQCRPPHSILYLTEVAVSPNARRRGIGSRLLEAIEELAEARNVETLYLHVDVTNAAAISLYEKAGYSRVTDQAMFREFTTSLNLHPGATKGRDHFLYYKDLTDEPTWHDDYVDASGTAAAHNGGVMVGSLGSRYRPEALKVTQVRPRKTCIL